jgi:uncharacterized protein (TIGR02145 family)
MKIISRQHIVIVIAVLVVFVASCRKKGSVPIVTTSEVSGITQTSAIGGGIVTDNGGDEISEYGVCWGIDPYPNIDGNKTSHTPTGGNFTSNFSGLSPNTQYYIRAYATNSAGTGYGDDIRFPTSGTAGPTVTDIDGNVYTTIYIGDKLWMAENLKVTHYNNGDSIPNIKDGSAWHDLTTGAYQDCFNDTSNIKTYGRLYNWYAVTDTRKIAPVGWHIPTDSEYSALTDYLGGNIAGGRMKEAGYAHWKPTNYGADNCSGFTGLPAGDIIGETNYPPGNYGCFWSCGTYYYSLSWDNCSFHKDNNEKTCGFSVRCVKN